MAEASTTADILSPDQLIALGACQEGTDWFEEAFGGDAARLEGLLEALVGSPHEDFLAWGFYRLPRLRRRVSLSFLHSLMGPRHVELAELADSLEGSLWLEPEPITDQQLTRLANTHIRRLGAFGIVPSLAILPIERRPLEGAWSAILPALAAFDEDATHVPPLRWALLWGAAVRAVEEAGWDDAMEAAQRAVHHVDQLAVGSPLPDGLIDEGFAAELEVERRARDAVKLGEDSAGLLRQTETAIGDRVFGAVFTCAQDHFGALLPSMRWMAASSALTAVVESDSDDEIEDNAVFWASATVASRAQSHVMSDALWLLAGSSRPSPWAPLVSLWRRGYWPVGLVGETFVVVDPSM